ncbi:hypothetical protein Q1695_000663 [Nippostrongylus brasiliensis]|nr:hypothetical protein Q1695_000663 [Nippostrongylus brasiliensis]
MSGRSEFYNSNSSSSYEPIFVLRIFSGCPTNAIFDAGTISRELYDMRKFLGGHTDVDLWLPFYKYASPFGQFKISCTCDLECYDFDSLLTKPCRWRNEKNTCSWDGDEVDYIRMKGSWGESEGNTIFGKSDRADGYFLIAGVQQKVPQTYSAMLVSDPIQCQEGDGVLQLKFWSSPVVKVRVCTRTPSMGKQYQWCSEPIKRNGTKPAKVIVIEAYNFTLNAFGKQGGAIAIDDISYNASAIYNCRMIPHYDPPVMPSTKTCSAVRCDFDRGSCLRKLDDGDWKLGDAPTGPRSSGIRTQHNGSFAYAVGPGTSSLTLGPFDLPRNFGIGFCYYVASYLSKFAVYVTKGHNDERERLYLSDEVSGNSHYWRCDRIFLNNGTYDAIEFSAEGLRNEYSYVGLDQIDIYDPLLGVSACEKSSQHFKPF